MLTAALFEFKTLDEARSIALLISNACPEPEKIVQGLTELTVSAVEHGNLEITYDEKSELNKEGTWLQEVSNRLLLSVFNTFIQTSKTKDGSGGTGLGLAICYEIILAHKGKIWAEHNPEGGAVFKVFLPIRSLV